MEAAPADSLVVAVCNTVQLLRVERRNRAVWVPDRQPLDEFRRLLLLDGVGPHQFARQVVLDAAVIVEANDGNVVEQLVSRRAALQEHPEKGPIPSAVYVRLAADCGALVAIKF